MKKLFIKRLLKRKYIIVDENDNFICSIDKNKKSIVECLVVTCNNEEWFTVKYKQKFIFPGFQIYNKNTNLNIIGTDSFRNGYKLTGTDIILNNVCFDTCDDTDSILNTDSFYEYGIDIKSNFNINYYAYDFMLNNNCIGSISHPSMDYNHYYTIIINDDTYLKDIIAISTGMLLCNYMKV